MTTEFMILGVEDWEIYCPFCDRNIIASNRADVENGDHDGYLFIHDDVPHDEEALTSRGWKPLVFGETV